VDLPQELHLEVCAAKRADQERAAIAYRIIELAEDLGGYGLSQFSTFGGGAIYVAAISIYVPPWIDEWLRRVALCEFLSFVSAWRTHERLSRYSERLKQAAAELRRYNLGRADTAKLWQEFAAGRAAVLRREDPFRPLRSIAVQIVEEALQAGAFDLPNAETVHRFLRDQHPHLKKSPKAQKPDRREGSPKR